MIFKYLFVLLAVLGVFLLGNGMTGMMIAGPESCCYGPGCTEENRCDSMRNLDKSTTYFALGGIMAVISVMGYIIIRRAEREN